MASLNIKRKAIDAMAVMDVAVSNIRLYPPISSIVRNTVDRVYQLLMDIIIQENSVIFAESEENFIICNQFFSEEDQIQNPQATAFLELLKEFGLKSISFEKKLTKPELKKFLEIIGRRPEEIEERGGLQSIFRNENLPNIVMDHKVYVVLDKDKKVVTSFDIRDEDIIRYVVGQHVFSESDMEKIRIGISLR